MTNFTFKTREEYLAYRQNWKAEYKAISSKIRNLKKEIKELQKAHQDAGKQQITREMLRLSQRNALVELAEAKLEAARQYEMKRELERKVA